MSNNIHQDIGVAAQVNALYYSALKMSGFTKAQALELAKHQGIKVNGKDE